MARLQLVALVVYLALVAALAWVRLEPHLTVRFARIELSSQPAVVSVSGAVRKPGLYRLPAGARVADAINAAGGAKANADLKALDLALPLADAESVRVPTRRSGEPAVVGAPLPVININSASLQQLESLPGIGPALARRIVAGRPYRTVDELLRVSGIGEKLLRRLRPLVVP